MEHFGSQNAIKITKKSIQISIEVLVRFVISSLFVFVDFESVLGSVALQKTVFRVGEVLFFRKSCFSNHIGFWIDF